MDKQKESNVIQMRLPKELDNRLMEEAKTRGYSKNQLIILSLEFAVGCLTDPQPLFLKPE